MKRQGIFLRTVKSRNRGRASERAVCGVFSDFSLAEPASHPAYAPTTKSPARYSAGRAKQHNHARNVKPFPSSEESGAGSARCLVRPGRSALPETVPRGEAIHISAPLSLGSARCLFRQSFCAAHSTMPRGSSPAFSSYPWPDLLATQPTHLPQQARRGIGPGGPSSIITPET